MESEKRNQEIIENNARTFKEDLFIIHGETAVYNVQQQDVTDFLLQLQTPYGPIRSDTKPKPLFPQAPQDPILQQHLRAVGMSQQSRKPNAASSSNNGPESTHELKGNVGRPRNHGVPTESRKDFPIGNQSQPSSLEHNYQIEDGEYLIFNILLKGGQSQND